MAVGFRPAANQLLKFGYTLETYSGASTDHMAVIQFVTNFRAFGFATR